MSLYKQLEDLYNLKHGWYWSEGLPVEPNPLLEEVLKEIDLLGYIHPPYLYPTPKGGVQLEWDCGISLKFEEGRVEYSSLYVDEE